MAAAEERLRAREASLAAREAAAAEQEAAAQVCARGTDAHRHANTGRSAHWHACMRHHRLRSVCRTQAYHSPLPALLVQSRLAEAEQQAARAAEGLAQAAEREARLQRDSEEAAAAQSELETRRKEVSWQGPGACGWPGSELCRLTGPVGE